MQYPFSCQLESQVSQALHLLETFFGQNMESLVLWGPFSSGRQISLVSMFQQLYEEFRPSKSLRTLYAACYGLLEPWMSDDSWTPTVTALFAFFFVILASWISLVGLFFVSLISWVEKLILKATVEPRFHPCSVAQDCLSSYNCLQQAMSTTFFAFFAYSQTDFIFAQSTNFILSRK